MNERIRRSRDSHEDYSYDKDLVEDNRGRSRRPPQYSDVCSQLSLKQLLEEDELFMSPAFRKKPTNNNNASMNEREHRGGGSNSKSRRRGIFDKYEEYHYRNDGESLLQSTNRSYEELRARDEELIYKDDEDWTFITEEEYQVKATNKSQNKSNTEQLESANLSTAEKLTESSENEKSVTPPLNVADLSSTEKLKEAMKRAALKLPKAVGEQLLAMVTGASLATMVGVLGAYAASHAVGIGIIADAVMAVGAGALIGWQAVTAAKDLWGFAQFVNATTEEELDKAGQHLANFVTTVGIDIVLGILTKRAASKIAGLDEAGTRTDDIDEVNQSIRRNRPATEQTIYNEADIGNEVSKNPVARKAYDRINNQGVDVVLTDELPAESGVAGELITNEDYLKIKIYESENFNVQDVVGTITHESNHVDFRYRKRRKLNSQYEEFRSFVREEMYRNSLDEDISQIRPTLEKRYLIWEDVKERYPNLREGKNPFGGKR